VTGPPVKPVLMSPPEESNMPTATPIIDRSTPIPEITVEVLIATRKLRSVHVPTVSDDVISLVIPRLFTDKPDRRNPKGRSTRVRSTPQVINHPDRTTANAARITGRLLRWHTSSGDLHGLFAAQWDAGELFEGLDTLAQTILVLSGQDSTALSAWKRTGLFS